MFSHTNISWDLDPKSLHECGNCKYLWSADKLEDIKNILERIEPGGIVPSGECPRCSMLCYPVKKEIKNHA